MTFIDGFIVFFARRFFAAVIVIAGWLARAQFLVFAAVAAAAAVAVLAFALRAVSSLIGA